MQSNLDLILSVSIPTALTSMLGFFAWIVTKLGKHDVKLAEQGVALSLLIQQVNPPGDKSLREILHDIQVEQARATIPNPSKVEYQ